MWRRRTQVPLTGCWTDQMLLPPVMTCRVSATPFWPAQYDRMNGRPVTRERERNDRRSPLSWPYLMSAKWPDISLEWGANAELWHGTTDFPRRQSVGKLRQFSATIPAAIIHT